MARRVAAKRKPLPVKAGRRRSGSTHFRKVPIGYVTKYSTVLLSRIREQLGTVDAFSRDDLLRIKTVEFEQTALITRYRATTIAVAYLIERGELTEMRSGFLCLPERAAAFQFAETTVSTQYAATIARLVRSMPKDKPFTIMQVVSGWRSDPQLTLDSKRKAVRNGIGNLVRQKICAKVSGFEYALGA